jgi:hypothetical protein
MAIYVFLSYPVLPRATGFDLDSLCDDGSIPTEWDISALWYSGQEDIVSLKDILDSYAMKFYWAGFILENQLSALRQLDRNLDGRASDEWRGAIEQNLKLIQGWCVEIRLNGISKYIQKNIEPLKPNLTEREMLKILEGVKERIEENLGSIYFKFVPPDESASYHFASVGPWGQQVLDNFSSASYDIEEAIKCRILGRHTACVMHLMRVCEVGLKAYGTSLNVMAQIKSAQADWGSILRIANEEIQKLNKGNDPTWTSDKRRFFEETHAHFHSVRVAFRNRSMHADQQYDYVRAKRIYEAVRDWVRFMAEHLDDVGNFTP